MRIVPIIVVIVVLLTFGINGPTAGKEWSTEEAKRAFGTEDDTVNPALLKSRKVSKSTKKNDTTAKEKTNKKNLSKKKQKNDEIIEEVIVVESYSDKSSRGNYEQDRPRQMEEDLRDCKNATSKIRSVSSYATEYGVCNNLEYDRMTITNSINACRHNSSILYDLQRMLNQHYQLVDACNSLR